MGCGGELWTMLRVYRMRTVQGVNWSRERAKIPVENQTSVKGMRARTALENAIWIVDTK